MRGTCGSSIRSTCASGVGHPSSCLTLQIILWKQVGTTMLSFHCTVTSHAPMAFYLPSRPCSINRVSTVHHQSGSLHEARLTTGEEKNAICHFLCSSHATHWCDPYSRCQHICVGLSHRRVYHAGTDCVDADEIFRVLRWHSVNMCCCDGGCQR